MNGFGWLTPHHRPSGFLFTGWSRTGLAALNAGQVSMARLSGLLEPEANRSGPAPCQQDMNLPMRIPEAQPDLYCHGNTTSNSLSQLMWVIMLVSLAPLVCVQAQETLPPDIYAVTPPLTPEQQTIIETYATFRSDQLCTGSDAEVSQARGKLKDPLSLPGTSEEFLKKYSIAMLNAVAACIKAPRVIVRLNVMYVATYIKRGASPIQLIGSGLADKSPGVRYWSAKAMATLAGRKDQNVANQKQILQTLTKSLGAENDAIVFSELLKALNALALPSAKDALLGILTGRVVVYETDPDALFEPIRGPLQKVYIDLVTRKLEGESVDQQLRDLARVAHLFMSLAGQQLETILELPTERQFDKAEMIKQGDTILRGLVDTLTPGTRKPEQIRNALRIKDWRFVLVQVERWQTLLLRSPFSFQEEELQVPRADNDKQTSALEAISYRVVDQD